MAEIQKSLSRNNKLKTPRRRCLKFIILWLHISSL